MERVPNAFTDYPLVRELMKDLVCMQLADVGGMLRLPVRHGDLIIPNGCNFAATAVLCNIVSGISVTIFQPDKTTKVSDDGAKVRWIDTDTAFAELLKSFFPWPSAADNRVKKDTVFALYGLCRTSFAHALGIHGDDAATMKIVRHRAHVGLTAEEVLEVEEAVGRPAWLQPGLNGSGKQWVLVADGLYRDALDMLCALAADKRQMEKAQKRFEEKKFNWRCGTPV
jgi:hypothetical protein